MVATLSPDCRLLVVSKVVKIPFSCVTFVIGTGLGMLEVETFDIVTAVGIENWLMAVINVVLFVGKTVVD